MTPHPYLAEHELLRAKCFHPEGIFLVIPENELDESLLPRFASVVERFPDHLAVQEGERVLTYRQLDDAANRVANALLAASGPQPCAIALLFGMELEWIIATLAVWKAGKFWVALDLRHPQARLSTILDDAQAPLLLTTARHHELAGALCGSERQLLTVEEALATFPADEPQIVVGPESYAYLVYTSGSTGRPKGVIENHTNILHMIAERGGLVHPSNADRIALLLPPAAGGAVYNIVLALWYGAALMLFEFVEEGVRRFEDWLLAAGITGMHAGVVLRTWLPTLDGRRQFPALRFLLLGAAPVYREHVEAFQRYIGGDCILINPYSSAEVRAVSLFAMDQSTALASQIIPVGYPPSWVTVEIWDENGNAMPNGATGEVIILTQYMTPGYWRQPELTANVFGVDAKNRRYYRSGDVGRLDADGCLWILGRKDRQIKIRGHRVEPAEVEVELLNVAGVREAAVIVHGTRDDETYLAAYVTLDAASQQSVADLRRAIAARLPSYMVPRQVTVMAKLPRNAYGKVDRPHLAAQKFEQQPDITHDSAALPIETKVDTLTMNHDVAEKIDRLTDFVNAEQVYAERVAIGERIYQAGGAAIPISPSEEALTMLHRWERMVECYGANLALDEAGQTLTYQELNALANRIAHAILARKLPNALPVGLLFDIEGGFPIGVLAAWKAGNFFTWFEPRQPLARNQLIVGESGAKVVITNRNHAELARQLWPDAGAVIVIEELDEDLPDANPPIAIDGSHPAYLIYTSGSTGQPKGTVELHRNLIHFMAARQTLFHFSANDRIAFILFGVGCIFSMAGALMYGGCVLPFQAKNEGLIRFSQWLIDRRVTMIIGGAGLRTWLLNLDGSQQFPALRWVGLSAGPSYREHVEAYQRYLHHDCLLVNLYSATEFRPGAIALIDKKSRLQGRLIPSGYTTAPSAIEIWNEEDQPQRKGETGEVVIVSPFLSAGYWKSPQLTAEKFGVDRQGRRFYRTGDLGRLDEQGCLWVLGRLDGQFKIRGNRVESAEVEDALRTLPNIGEAAVIDSGETDEERGLVAFVASPATVTGVDLRKQLATLLPDYMIPATIVVLDELPRNAAGKVDRPALRAMPGRTLEIGTEVSTMTLDIAENPETKRVTVKPSGWVDPAARAQQAAIMAKGYHPTGEYLPITSAESELTSLHRWEKMVARYGANEALEEGDRRLSYAEMNAQINRLAHAIRAHKVPKKIPVAIIYDVEGDLAISIFAIWKAGNFFVWLEPNQPLARNRFIVEDSEAPLVVTNRKYAEIARQLWPADKVIVIEELADDLPTYNPPITIEAADPAYLMYTSGSTGKPKGTIDLHRNLLAMFVARQDYLHFSTHDRVNLLVLASGWSFATLAAWLYGGCLLPYRAKEEGLARFSQWLIERRVTITIGGSILRTWLMTLDGSQQFPHLRGFTIGAAPTYREHVQVYQQYLSDSCIALNTYSATEARVITLFAIDKETRLETRVVPAGYPMSNGAIEIWDDDGKPLPTGAIGEVVIFSPHVAAGYWKSPELTASRFGIDAQGRRYYRVGDLGWLDEQGCLLVLGRKDNQVKIRGNRVETAEVEVALLELAGVQESAVIHIGETDEKRALLGFVAANAGISGSELRKQLAARLPDYMVPATIIVLEELPRNANGKVARPLLREMAVAFSVTNRESRENEAVLQPERVAETVTGAQTRVARMVSELLGGNEIGPHDNFFDVGGHSLLAARLMLTIHRTFGVDLAPRDFFTDPTIAGLAASVDRELAKQMGPTSTVESEKPLAIEAIPVLSGAADTLPIFLCIGRNGALDILMIYQELIRRLGRQRSLYGLVANGRGEADAIYATVGELVDTALAAVRRVQPRGPYLLIGECIGGKLAYEMARKLTQAGEQVAFLTLLDASSRPYRSQNSAANPTLKSIQRLTLKWYGRFFYHMRQMFELGWKDGTSYLVERLAAVLPASLHPNSTYRAQYLAHKRYFDLLTHHDPSEPYDHSLGDCAVTAMFSHEYYHHADKWATLIQQLEVVKVEGTHTDYLSVSGDEVAGRIRKALEAAPLKKII